MILNKIIRQPLEAQLSITPSIDPRPPKLLDRIYETIPPTDSTNKTDRCITSYSSATLESLLIFNLSDRALILTPVKCPKAIAP